jgi:RimJ/RimL family protein N-acetyltransferase
MCTWLCTYAGATAITATSVVVGNDASRRVLEKLGFVEVDADDRHVSYLLARTESWC